MSVKFKAQDFRPLAQIDIKCSDGWVKLLISAREGHSMCVDFDDLIYFGFMENIRKEYEWRSYLLLEPYFLVNRTLPQN
jgi:hypothetical protein